MISCCQSLPNSLPHMYLALGFPFSQKFDSEVHSNNKKLFLLVNLALKLWMMMAGRDYMEMLVVF